MDMSKNGTTHETKSQTEGQTLASPVGIRSHKALTSFGLMAAHALRMPLMPLRVSRATHPLLALLRSGFAAQARRVSCAAHPLLALLRSYSAAQARR